ncbi:MAG TPA: intradiol ring-cleavage dioxygenase [Actinomycetota bacterium]|nr:intradiol ring-cleavage dioxygenase [Actinomycetota bacterium]
MMEGRGGPPLTEHERAITRRRAIALMGAAGLAAVAAACTTGSSVDAPTTTAAGAGGGSTGSGTTGAGGSTGSANGVACVLTPEQTEGPFYLPDEALRSDVTEGLPGTALRLDLTVADASTCAAIPNATVEVWQADAAGDYSGFGGGASSSTFLRGGQVSDVNGKVAFDTIYPGWYPGRTVHIHVKVHVGGDVVHTGQLYFHDALTDRVFAAPPYDDRPGPRTLNDQDAIYGNGGRESTLDVSKQGKGYVGTMTMGVRTS